MKEENLKQEIKINENKNEIIEEIAVEIINDLSSDFEIEIENKKNENKINVPESFNHQNDDIMIPSEEFLNLENNNFK